jgi:hypothetical protein
MIRKILLSAALLAAPVAAQATDIPVSGAGWCSANFGCNSNTTSISNTFAGVVEDAGEFRDFFAVAVPLGTFTSASLSIWNDGQNWTDNGAAVYGLHAATGISLDGLAAGPVLGSVLLGDADTGDSHYVTIALNDAGLAALNGAAGSTFLFGGVVTGGGHLEFAGYTNGTPAAYLTINGTSPAPEPASWAMMIGGFGAIGAAMRRRQRTAIAFG